MKTYRLTTALILGVLLWLTPASAHADGLFTPWLGVNFANEPADGRTSFGVTATGMGAGVIGGEFDFGYSPNFFGEESVFGSNNVLTVVGNLVLGIPLGGSRGFGFRPYGTVGLGLIRRRGSTSSSPISRATNSASTRAAAPSCSSATTSACAATCGTFAPDSTT